MGITPLFPAIVSPSVISDTDTTVRCLSYLCGKIDEIISLPVGITAKVVPIQYVESVYPAIGLFAVKESDWASCPDSQILEQKIDNYVHKIGLEPLIELAKDETLTWQMLEMQIKSQEL
ncbi:MAG: hypothetical protein EOP04_23150 [Proteobacteria bacterium]|nr:MAG: hypothetical protein EOP04_23150 [Pseudomonadota bacterium]